MTWCRTAPMQLHRMTAKQMLRHRPHNSRRLTTMQPHKPSKSPSWIATASSRSSQHPRAQTVRPKQSTAVLPLDPAGPVQPQWEAATREELSRGELVVDSSTNQILRHHSLLLQRKQSSKHLMKFGYPGCTGFSLLNDNSTLQH